MGKLIVIQKAIVEKYWDNYIEKALSHKYIRKIPNGKGGWNYIYPSDFSKPMKVLLSIFGLKEEKIDDAYNKQNIQADYGADKKTFASHVLEYLSNRATWNKFFNDKFNRDRYKTPVKFEPKKSELKTKVENGEIKNNGKTTDKTGKEHNETKEKDFKAKWNNSLMRKIYSMYNPIPEDKKTETTVGPVAFNIGDAVSKDGKVGKITKDYGNGMYFVNFDNGGMGRFNSVELQNLNPTNQEVSNAADVNAVEQEVEQNRNDVLSENPSNEISDKPGYSDVEKIVIALAYKKEKNFDPTLSDYAYYEKIKEKMPEIAEKGKLYSTMLEVKDMMLNDSKFQAAKEYLENMKKDNDTKVAELQENTAEINTNSYDKKHADYLIARFLGDGDFNRIANYNKIAIANNLYGDTSMMNTDTGRNTIDYVYNKIQELSKLSDKELKSLYRKEYKSIYDSGDEQLDYTPYINDYINIYKDVSIDVVKKELEETKSKVNFYSKEPLEKQRIKLLEAVLQYKESNPLEEHQNRSEAMIGNQNAKGKHRAKPKTDSENKKEKAEENKARRKAGLKTPNEELGERSSAIEDVDVQNHEFNETEETAKEELKNEVKTPSNKAQKDAFNELAAARYNLRKKEYGTSFYGKMNNKLVSTDEEVLAAQKRYDEALANYNKLIGADNSDYSYNPNAENYAYRDTGYIAGSQKEKIAQFWADVAERGGGVNVEDIDWVALEENLRYAESKIIKSNILKKPDFEALRDSGMSGGAAYFYNRLIDCIPTKPAENTPEMHRQYVLAINTFQDRMEKCKTVNEMAKEMREIAEELSGVMVGTNTLPEVIEIQNQIDELDEWKKIEINEFSNAKGKLWEIPLIKEFTENNTSFVRKAYGKPYPFAYPGLSSTKDSKLQVNFMSFLSNNDKWFTFMKENENELMKYPQFKAYKDILDKSEIIERNRYYQNRNVILPTTKKINELEKEKKEVIQKKNDEYMATSSEYKMWEAFGDKNKGRFAEYMRSADGFDSFIYRGNKTILGHYKNAKRGKFDDWEWLPKKEENSVSGEKKERKESFQLLVATEHERKGGKNVSVKTTQELKEMFNLRDIQSGEWVLNDPKSAQWHVDRCCEGFADLCDVTGIPENLVSLNGRLALAIGARGHKGALAHYEPVERVINITKMHGGGSLAHEWFHAFDNMLSEAMLGGNINAWLTKPGTIHHKDAPDNVIPEVKQAFSKLVDAMKKGTNPVMKSVKVSEADRKNPDRVLRSVLYYRNYSGSAMNVYSDVMKATTFEEANKVLMNNFKSLTTYGDRFVSSKVKDFQKAQKAIAAKFGRDTADVFTGETASNFFINSWKLDGDGKKSYWSTTHEMAARAFSGFIGDNLRKAGRLNTYLTSHDTNVAYGFTGFKPNPEGEERERINKAFKELFDVIKSTGAIRKAIDILDNFIEKSAEPRFIIKGGRFLIRK